MPLDVLGRTRATLKEAVCLPDSIELGNPSKLFRARDWGLQLSFMNEEFPVSASHKLVLTTSLPFVHTARRYYRLNGYSEHMGLVNFDWQQSLFAENYGKLDYLEEVKVVTRFP